jgi:hypothetical protein
MAKITLALVMLGAVGWGGPVVGQGRMVEEIPSDVESPRAIVLATYAAVAREPGKPYDWTRFRSLFQDGALLIPNVEQTGGVFTPLTVDGFIAWVEGMTDPASPADRGFLEGEVHRIEERYGDIAHVFSTYEKHFWADETVLGRGVNSFQMVRHDGRWWITAIIWDEPTGGEPIPERYLP